MTTSDILTLARAIYAAGFRAGFQSGKEVGWLGEDLTDLPLTPEASWDSDVAYRLSEKCDEGVKLRLDNPEDWGMI